MKRTGTAGKLTGLVTESFLTDASPAAHGAHESSRSSTSAIFLDFVNQTRPNVILGGGGNGFSSSAATSAGYAVVTDLNGLAALDTESVTYVAGGFGGGLIPPAGYPGRRASLPTLPQMTEQALKILDNDPDGFYLFVEHEGVDEYAHANDATNLVRSVAEFSAAVQLAVDWVNDPLTPADWTNTLFVVVGDHETGGITDVVNNGAGAVPGISWTTTGHTTTPVRVLAQGAGAEQVPLAQIDNTNIFSILSPAISAPAAPGALVAASASSSQINLAWTDNSGDEDSFKIERSPDGAASWAEIATVGANVDAYSDTGLTAGATYYFRVRASNAGGSSSYPNVAAATTLTAPTMHSGDLDGTSSVSKKNWTASVAITVHDGQEAPVAGATVTGAWSNGATGSVTCTTGTTGTCVVRKTNLKTSVGAVTFTVTGVSKSGVTYIPAANHDVDGGSDGTTAQVLR